MIIKRLLWNLFLANPAVILELTMLLQRKCACITNRHHYISYFPICQTNTRDDIGEDVWKRNTLYKLNATSSISIRATDNINDKLVCIDHLNEYLYAEMKFGLISHMTKRNYQNQSLVLLSVINTVKCHISFNHLHTYGRVYSQRINVDIAI